MSVRPRTSHYSLQKSCRDRSLRGITIFLLSHVRKKLNRILFCSLVFLARGANVAKPVRGSGSMRYAGRYETAADKLRMLRECVCPFSQTTPGSHGILTKIYVQTLYCTQENKQIQLTYLEMLVQRPIYPFKESLPVTFEWMRGAIS